MIFAIVDINGTILSFKSKQALAGIVAVMINTPGIVLAWVKQITTKQYFCFTKFTYKTTTLISEKK